MSWRERAACLGRPLEQFFHEGRQSAELRALCLSCPVRRDCFDDVMASEKKIPLTHRAGFYAGLSPAERHGIEHRQERPGFFGGRPWWAPVARPHVCATDGCRCGRVPLQVDVRARRDNGISNHQEVA